MQPVPDYHLLPNPVSQMEETTWEERIRAVTHLLTAPPSAAVFPPLHSQLFLGACAPCYTRWDFPPFLCRRLGRSPLPGVLPPLPLLLDWSISFFLSRGACLGRPAVPASSWRSKCPFQQPPPRVLSSVVEPAPARWGAEELRAYFRGRLRRRRLGIEVPTLVAVAAPNMLLFSLLLWDPLCLRQQKP